MNHMRSMFQANPELMGKLLLGETVDLGDGLSVKLLSTKWFTWEGKTQDLLEFNFYLEGQDIGTLDQEFGGCIQHDINRTYEKKLSEEQEMVNENLFTQVSIKWIELFKSHAKKVLVGI